MGIGAFIVRAKKHNQLFGAKMTLGGHKIIVDKNKTTISGKILILYMRL